MIEIVFWPQSQRYWDSKAWIVGWVEEEKRPHYVGETTTIVRVRTTVVLGCVETEHHRPQGLLLDKDHSSSLSRTAEATTTTTNVVREHQLQREELQRQIDVALVSKMQCDSCAVDPSTSTFRPNDGLRQLSLCASGLRIVGVFDPSTNVEEEDDDKNHHKQPNRCRTENNDRREKKKEPVFVQIIMSKQPSTNNIDAQNDDDTLSGGRIRSFPWFQTSTSAPDFDKNENNTVQNNPQALHSMAMGQIVFYDDSFRSSYRNACSTTTTTTPPLNSQQPQNENQSLQQEGGGDAVTWLIRIHNAPVLYQELMGLLQQRGSSFVMTTMTTTQEGQRRQSTMTNPKNKRKDEMSSIVQSPPPDSSFSSQTQKHDQSEIPGEYTKDSLTLLNRIALFLSKQRRFLEDMIAEHSLLFRLMRKYHQDPTSWPFRILLLSLWKGQQSFPGTTEQLLLKDERLREQVNRTGAILHAAFNVLLGLAVSWILTLNVWLRLRPNDTISTEVTLAPFLVWFYDSMQWHFQWLTGTLLVWLQNNPIGIKINPHLANALSSNLSCFLDAVAWLWLQSLQVLVASVTGIGGTRAQGMLWVYQQAIWVLFVLIPTVMGGFSAWSALVHDLWQLTTCHVRIIAQVVGAIFQMECHVLAAAGRLFRGQKRNVLRNNRTDSMKYDSTQLLLGSIVFAVALFLFTTVLVHHVAFACLEWALVHAVSRILVAVHQTSVEKLPLVFGALYYQNVKGMKWFAQDLYFMHEGEAIVHRLSSPTRVDVTNLHSTQYTTTQLLWSTTSTARTKSTE